jgi:MRN-interacting protein
MVQEFWVLKCYDAECRMFQVVLKRKVLKFNCKVCHRKQSVRTIHAKAHKAALCRQLVQDFNRRQFELHEQFSDQDSEKDEDEEQEQEVLETIGRWKQFVGDGKDDGRAESDDDDEEHYTTVRPEKPKQTPRQRKRVAPSKRPAEEKIQRAVKQQRRAERAVEVPPMMASVPLTVEAPPPLPAVQAAVDIDLNSFFGGNAAGKSSEPAKKKMKKEKEKEKKSASSSSRWAKYEHSNSSSDSE